MKTIIRRIIIASILLLLTIVVGWFVWVHERAMDDEDAPLEASSSLESQDDAVLIDFASCAPGMRRFDVAFGSTTIQIKGKEKDACVILYGGEVENPNWDGKLDTTCKVPVSLGQATFAKGSAGIDLSVIDEYCS